MDFGGFSTKNPQCPYLGVEEQLPPPILRIRSTIGYYNLVQYEHRPTFVKKTCDKLLRTEPPRGVGGWVRDLSVLWVKTGDFSVLWVKTDRP